MDMVEGKEAGVERCGTCKHFDADEDCLPERGEGWCEMTSNKEPWGSDDTMVVISGDWAWLHVRADFGCVLHKPIETKESK